MTRIIADISVSPDAVTAARERAKAASTATHLTYDVFR